MMMIRFCASILCAGFLLAQNNTVPSEPAPPEVDAALRARVRQFFQAHVDGKYRIADQVVAEESKDAFFAATKPRYLGFEIVRINYSENFTKAQAVVFCESDWYFHGNKSKVKMPANSMWKLIDGQWYWYVLPVTEFKTPFGTMHYNTGASPDGKPPAPVPAIPADPQVMAQQILQSVRADKTELMLSSYQPATGEVKIVNGMQGPITLRVDIDGRLAGMTSGFDKTELKAGESAILKISYEPKDRIPKPTLTARVYVEPTNQIIPIQLFFAIPPDLEKLIPKDARQKPPAP
jgi:hypothetical protein